MRLKRVIWLGVAAGGTVLVLGWLLSPAPVPVDVVPAEIGPMAVTVGDEGMTRVRDRYLVTAPVAGRAERIRLEPGDTVLKGSVVALLHPLPLDARGRLQAQATVAAAADQRQVATAAVEQARIALAEARLDRERGERLAAGGGVAPVDVERLRFAEQSRQRELEAARFRVRVAAHEEEIARAALVAADPTLSGDPPLTLRAPASGRVLAVPEPSERVVPAGTVLLELGDPTVLEVVVDLLSTDAVRVTSGARMQLFGWGGDSVLTGWVRRVEPSAFTRVSALGVEEQRVNLIGDFCDPTGRLGDRYRVEIQVVLWQADRVLRIPPSALARLGDAWEVFRVENGRARARRVSVGHESELAVEILDGLREGDLVIRHPSERITDGVRVRPRP